MPGDCYGGLGGGTRRKWAMRQRPAAKENDDAKCLHDETINGDDFTEDNADKVLGGNSRSLDAGSEDTRSGDEDTPGVSLFAVLAEEFATYHAAPTTENPIQLAMPRSAHIYGEVLRRKWPTSNDSPAPVNSWSVVSQKKARAKTGNRVWIFGRIADHTAWPSTDSIVDGSVSNKCSEIRPRSVATEECLAKSADQSR